MINLPEFIKALKISWFRRVIQNSENIEWYSLSKLILINYIAAGLDTL